MSAVLAIAALTVLAGLGVLSFMRQRETAASEKRQSGARSHLGDAQRDRSRALRAAARSDSEQDREGQAQEAPPPTGTLTDRKSWPPGP